MKALETLIARHPDSKEYPWLLDEVRSAYQPVTLIAEKLKKYPGKYGEHQILDKDGELYFQHRFLQFWMRLLSENIFWLDGPEMLQPYRIDIDEAEMLALYPDGRQISLGAKTK